MWSGLACICNAQQSVSTDRKTIEYMCAKVCTFICRSLFCIAFERCSQFTWQCGRVVRPMRTVFNGDLRAGTSNVSSMDELDSFIFAATRLLTNRQANKRSSFNRFRIWYWSKLYIVYSKRKNIDLMMINRLWTGMVPNEKIYYIIY